MVVEVFVAERDAEHALPDKRAHAMLDQFRNPSIDEAGSEPIDEARSPDRRPQKQAAGVRRDRPAVEISHHLAPLDRSKEIGIRATVCRHRGAPPSPRKLLMQNNFR
jgi:hypothetical protein